MAKVRVEVEIDASPEKVRGLVLDFPHYSEWHTSFMVEPSTVPPGKDPYAVVPGDKIKVNFSGNILEAVIVSNTSEELRWSGSLMFGALAGEHYFQFKESKVKPGATTFVHGEDYKGWMTWLFDDWWLGALRGSVEELYAGYAHDVKKKMEQTNEHSAS